MKSVASKSTTGHQSTPAPEASITVESTTIHRSTPTYETSLNSGDAPASPVDSLDLGSSLKDTVVMFLPYPRKRYTDIKR